MKLEACPFCGSTKIGPDTLKGQTKTIWRIQCQSCLGNTGWRETQSEAERAWNTRQQAAAVLPSVIVNDDLFFVSGAVYARNPRTGSCYCNITPDIENAKGKRIAKKLYLEALEGCKGGS